MIPLADMTVAEIARSIAGRTVSAREAVEAAVSRIEATDDRLKAWTHIDPEGALRAAKEIDDRPGGDPDRTPLAGVPFGVKDVIDVEGMPTGAGFKPFSERVAAQDAAIVRLLRGAGAIPIGKVSTAQFAILDPPETVNPWNPDLTPGGSSTGSGVAVAARQVPFALGTQTGGSILRPAGYNGIVGFKPTYGLFPVEGMFPTAPSIDHIGILARSVEDCGLLTSVAKGGRKFRPTPPPISPFRIGFLVETIATADDSVITAVRNTIDAATDAGADVVEVQLDEPITAYSDVYRIHLQSEALAVHARLFGTQRRHYGHMNRALLDVATLLPPWAVIAAQEARVRLRHGFESGFRGAGVDALLLPVSATKPPSRDTTGSSAMLSPFSLVGAPSIAVPTELLDGLPASIQLVGLPGADHELLKVAAWIESLVPGVPAPPT